MFANPDLQRHVGKLYGKYSGEVTENQDDEHWADQRQCAIGVRHRDDGVARPCLPYGHFFIPHVGAKVWVEFEAGDPSYPLWVGAWYPSGTVPPEAAIAPPDNRVIQTPSGHTIELHGQGRRGEDRHPAQTKLVRLNRQGRERGHRQPERLDADPERERRKFVLVEQHGNSVTMTENGIVIVNSDGSAAVELSADMARVAAKNIVLQGSTVALGADAAEPTIMGQAFKTMWDMFIFHTHATAMGPSGPPLPPAQPLLPGVTLTSAVVVK